MLKITLSCDCGDGLANDAARLPHIDAANIACGSHVITPDDIDQCLALCMAHQIAAGASPGVHENDAIGRRITIMAPDDIARSVRRQVAALHERVAQAGLRIAHVRLHGALNAFASTDADVAAAIVTVLADFDPSLRIVAPFDSRLLDAARRARQPLSAELTADRRYEPDGGLRGKSLPGAILRDAEACAAQIVSALRDGYVSAHDGSRVYLDIDSARLSSDSGVSPAALRRLLTRAGVVCGQWTGDG
jgi:UPF0271 protein